MTHSHGGPHTHTHTQRCGRWGASRSRFSSRGRWNRSHRSSFRIIYFLSFLVFPIPPWRWCVKVGARAGKKAAMSSAVGRVVQREGDTTMRDSLRIFGLGVKKSGRLWIRWQLSIIWSWQGLIGRNSSSSRRVQIKKQNKNVDVAPQQVTRSAEFSGFRRRYLDAQMAGVVRGRAPADAGNKVGGGS